jgi:hypothetical protein
MLQNIILIVLIIMLIFFISNEKKINDLITKKYTKYLFLLLIIYFIYQGYNFVLLVIALLIVIFFNIDIKEKFENNNLLSEIANKAMNYYNNYIKSDKKEGFLNQESENNENKKMNTEPFKNDIKKIKDLYENIKEEIKKINN